MITPLRWLWFASAVAAASGITSDLDKKEYSVSASGERTLLLVRTAVKLKKDNNIEKYSQPRPSDNFTNEVFYDEKSFAKQIGACSNNKIEFVPAEVPNGMVDMEVEVDFQDNGGQLAHVISQAVCQELRNMEDIDLDKIDHLAVFAPDMTGHYDGWYSAFAGSCTEFSWAWQTDRGDIKSTNVHVVLHEIGHNLGLRHTGATINGKFKVYGDTSGSMGDGSFNPEVGLCFNAYNSARLGWYTEELFDGSSSWEGKLIGVADYSKRTSDIVILKIPYGEQMLFISYGSKKGITDGIHSRFENKVNIVLAPYGQPPCNSCSHVEASLDKGQTYGFTLNGKEWNLKVTEKTIGNNIDYATVTITSCSDIYVDYECNENSECTWDNSTCIDLPPVPDATLNATCFVNDFVTAVWSGDDCYYDATINSTNLSNGACKITVDWDDGDTSHREVDASDVMKNGGPCTQACTQPEQEPEPQPESTTTESFDQSTSGSVASTLYVSVCVLSAFWSLPVLALSA